jgi:DegV family protein with EDD domain
MKIRIVSDSTCDLPQELLEKYKISIVPCFINFGDESFLDKIQISRADFYQRISKSEEYPKTAAPGVGLFTEVYNRLADEGAQEIISIHIRTGPSNMSNVAGLAAQAFDRARVHVVEVGQVAITLGYLVVQAAKAVAEGKSIEDVVAMVKEKDQRAYLFAALDSLEYLKRSGRVPSLLVDLANLFNIKPVLLLRLGNISIVDRVRTASKQIDTLIKLADQQAPLEWIGVAHTNTPDRVIKLAEAVKSHYTINGELWIEEATPILGVHVGPGALGIACVRAARN